MNYEKKEARMLSRMGPRPVYGQALSSLAAKNNNVIALSADLGRSSGLDRFSKENPNQFINTGIAEQNLIGCAAGLARAGLKVYASTFAPFASLRAGEQVRMNMGYMQEPVKLFALGSGLSLGFLGNSHFGLEDLSVIRSIPEVNIICPADCFEIYKTIEALQDFNKPAYVRITGSMNCPIVYENDYDFKIGRAIEVCPINEINVLSHGSIVGNCKIAIQDLEKENNINIGLVNFHTIRPIDEEMLTNLAEKSKKILIFEEHLVDGGLSTAVLEFFNKNRLDTRNIYRFGIDTWIKKSGNYDFMLKELGLDKNGIKSKIHELITE